MANAATSRAGWTTVAFGDVVRLSTERSSNPESDGFERFVGLEHIEPGDLRIRQWGDVADGTTFTSVFRPGQVLFGKRRAYQRKVAVADFSGVCSGDIYVLEPKGKNLLPELVPFICQTDAFFEHAVGTSAGSLSPRTNWTSLSEFEFALPGLEAQRLIAEVLQAASQQDHALLSSLDAVEQLISTYSLFCFSTLHSDEGVPKRPLGGLLMEDISNGIFRKKEQFGTGTRMINVTDVYSGLVVPTEDLVRVPVNEDEYESFSAKPGDVIFNRSSLVLTGIGHACLVPDAGEDLVFECHLMRARPNPQELDARFLCHYALSPHGRRHLMSRAQTTTMTTIGQGDLREMVIPCPDLAAQRTVAANLDQLYLAKSSLSDRRRQLSKVSRVILEYVLENPGAETA